MKLIIDIGNTRVKAAVFEGKNLLHFFAFANTTELLDSGIITQYNIRNSIICTVVDNPETFAEALRKQTPVLVFESNTPCPIVNAYKSGATLGSDRLAASVGGNFLAPNENVLVIDAGTCIKYNFVNARNEYIGGAISPGLHMRFKALHTFTARLPLLVVDENFDTLTGTTTAESMLAGAQLGAVAEIEGFIDRYQRDFNNLKVFLTGGDTEFFAKRLKKRIFADQFLILKGLNEILDHNLKEY